MVLALTSKARQRGASAISLRSVGRMANGAPRWFEKTLFRGGSCEIHNSEGVDCRFSVFYNATLESIPTTPSPEWRPFQDPFE